MRFTIFSLIFSLVIAASHFNSASAQMRRGMHGRMMGRMMGPGHGRCYGDREHMRKNLQLSDKQIERIGKINGKYRYMLVKFKDQLRPRKAELKKVLLNKSPDFAVLRSILKKISEIEVEIRLIKVKQSLEIEKVFNSSQRERMRRERGFSWN